MLSGPCCKACPELALKPGQLEVYAHRRDAENWLESRLPQEQLAKPSRPASRAVRPLCLFACATSRCPRNQRNCQSRRCKRELTNGRLCWTPDHAAPLRACRALGWRLQRAAPVQASTNEEHARKKQRLNETIGEMLIDFCNIFVKHRDVPLVARQAMLDYLAKYFNKGSWTRSSMHGAVVGGRWRVHALAATPAALGRIRALA